jgi:tetratricopeptide (TPR) repeat protein
MKDTSAGSQTDAPLNDRPRDVVARALPAFVTEPLRCVRQESDDVHQFVRRMACAESVIKFLAACTHGVLADLMPSLPSNYVDRIHDRFIPQKGSKFPGLGDWVNLFKDSLRSLGEATPDWLQPIRDFTDQEFSSGTPEYAFCSLIDRLRRANAEVPEVYNGEDLFDRITKLRNHYSHGALTGGFAARVNPPFEAALASLARSAIRGRIRVIAIKRFCPSDRDLIEVIDVETHDVLRLSTQGMDGNPEFRDVYVGPFGSKSMEDFTRLGAFVRYDYDRRDVLIFNGRDSASLRYLSYRSGDVHDGDHSAKDLAHRFCVARVELPSEVPAESPAATPLPSGTIPQVSDQPKEQDVPQLETGASQDQVVQQPSQAELREKAERDFELLLDAPRLGASPHALLSRWELRLTSALSLAQRHEFFENTWKSVVARKMVNSEQAHFLGSLAQRLGIVERAVQIFREMLKAAPLDKELMSRLGNALLVLGREQKARGNREESKASFGEALRVLKTAFPAGPMSDYERSMAARTFSCAVSAASRLGDYGQAISIAEQGLKVCPGDQQLQSQLDYHRDRER